MGINIFVGSIFMFTAEFFQEWALQLEDESAIKQLD
jgi:hypothetical protein